MEYKAEIYDDSEKEGVADKFLGGPLVLFRIFGRDSKHDWTYVTQGFIDLRARTAHFSLDTWWRRMTPWIDLDDECFLDTVKHGGYRDALEGNLQFIWENEIMQNVEYRRDVEALCRLTMMCWRVKEDQS